VNAAGTPQWETDGVALCTASDDQWWPSIVSDGTGGAIVAWGDRRSGLRLRVYAQRSRGSYMGPEPVIASVRDVPNDQGGLVKVAWHASG